MRMSQVNSRRPHVVDNQTVAWEVVSAKDKFVNFFSFSGGTAIREESS